MKVKYRLREFAAVGLVVSLLAVTPIVAAQDSGSSSSGSDDVTKTETDTTNRGDRLAKFALTFKVALNSSEKEHIMLKCVGSQGVVGKLNTKFGNSVTRRTQAYTELTKNLDNLVTKLQAKSVDTTTLESEITTLKSKIATYSTDLTAYKQALGDLKAVDCKADPTGFQAALEAARSAHDKLVTDVTDIKTYLKATIKPTLVTIRTQLESSDSSKQASPNPSVNGGSN